MAFKPVETFQGVVDFTNIDTAKQVQPGMIIRGIDTASGAGGGEFMYLPGVTGTVVGSLVTYNPLKPSSTLIPSTKNLGQPVAVAMAAVATTTNYGWYQIGGVAVVKKTAVKVNPAVAIFISGTAGRVAPTVASGKQILCAISVNAATVASATSTIQVLINRSFAQGQTI